MRAFFSQKMEGVRGGGVQSGWKGARRGGGGGAWGGLGGYCLIDVSMCLFLFLIQALGTSRLIIVPDVSLSLPPSVHHPLPSPPLHPTPFALMVERALKRKV